MFTPRSCFSSPVSWGRFETVMESRRRLQACGCLARALHLSGATNPSEGWGLPCSRLPSPQWWGSSPKLCPVFDPLQRESQAAFTNTCFCRISCTHNSPSFQILPVNPRGSALHNPRLQLILEHELRLLSGLCPPLTPTREITLAIFQLAWMSAAALTAVTLRYAFGISGGDAIVDANPLRLAFTLAFPLSA